MIKRFPNLLSAVCHILAQHDAINAIFGATPHALYTPESSVLINVYFLNDNPVLAGQIAQHVMDDGEHGLIDVTSNGALLGYIWVWFDSGNNTLQAHAISLP